MLSLGLVLVFPKGSLYMCFSAKLMHWRMLRVDHAVQHEVWVTTDFLKSALLWDITQCVVVVPYRRFGTTYQSHIQGSRYRRKNFRMELLLLLA
jgi:hypothetical protein